MAPTIPPPPPGMYSENIESSPPPRPPPPPMKPIVSPLYSTSNAVVIKIVLRAITAVLTFISLIILTTNKFKLTVIYEGYYYDTATTYKLKFNDFISYRYMLFTIVLALLYSLFQLALTISQLKSGQRISKVLVYVDFFGDLVLVYALATGAAAGFAVSVDYARDSDDFHIFYAKANAAASMIFLGSVGSVGSLIFAAFGLEERF